MYLESRGSLPKVAGFALATGAAGLSATGFTSTLGLALEDISLLSRPAMPPLPSF